MEQADLRAAQRPLKERYRADPTAAVVTLHAAGSLDPDGVSCSIDTGRALVEAGLHPATGGTGLLACSGEMLLEALVACAGVTLRAVATNRGLEVGGTVRAEGDWDARGTLGIDPDAAVGLGPIRLTFDLDSDAPAEELDALVATTERYCVVLQTLLAGPTIQVARS